MLWRDAALGFGGLVLGAIISLIIDVFFHGSVEEVKWWLVRWWSPSIIVFESSSIAGCTPLAPLLSAAEKEGLSYDPEMKLVRLCDSRRFQGTARRILEDVTTVFNRCFMIDEKPKMLVRNSASQVCKAHYALDSRTNEWVKTNDDGVVLCFPDTKRIIGSPPDEPIPARPC